MKTMRSILMMAFAVCMICSAFTTKPTLADKVKTGNGDSTLYFGEKLSDAAAFSSLRLQAMMQGKDSLKVKVMGKIESVCQKKGCWMTMPIGDGKTMMVRFKDYGFFAPKDASGRTAVIEGYAYTETISVEMLKHYAEDGGKSKAEIDKITQPETNITFMAAGMAIVQK